MPIRVRLCGKYRTVPSVVLQDDATVHDLRVEAVRNFQYECDASKVIFSGSKELLDGPYKDDRDDFGSPDVLLKDTTVFRERKSKRVDVYVRFATEKRSVAADEAVVRESRVLEGAKASLESLEADLRFRRVLSVIVEPHVAAGTTGRTLRLELGDLSTVGELRSEVVSKLGLSDDALLVLQVQKGSSSTSAADRRRARVLARRANGFGGGNVESSMQHEELENVQGALNHSEKRGVPLVADFPGPAFDREERLWYQIVKQEDILSEEEKKEDGDDIFLREGEKSPKSSSILREGEKSPKSSSILREGDKSPKSSSTNFLREGEKSPKSSGDILREREMGFESMAAMREWRARQVPLIKLNAAPPSLGVRLNFGALSFWREGVQSRPKLRRMGILFGRVCADTTVEVRWCYVPPQRSSRHVCVPEFDVEEWRRVGLIASALECEPVGWIVSRCEEEEGEEEGWRKRRAPLEAWELLMAARLQDRFGPVSVTLVCRVKVDRERRIECKLEGSFASPQCVAGVKAGEICLNPAREDVLQSKRPVRLMRRSKAGGAQEETTHLIPVEAMTCLTDEIWGSLPVDPSSRAGEEWKARLTAEIESTVTDPALRELALRKLEPFEPNIYESFPLEHSCTSTGRPLPPSKEQLTSYFRKYERKWPRALCDPHALLALSDPKMPPGFAPEGFSSPAGPCLDTASLRELAFHVGLYLHSQNSDSATVIHSFRPRIETWAGIGFRDPVLYAKGYLSKAMTRHNLIAAVLLEHAEDDNLPTQDPIAAAQALTTPSRMTLHDPPLRDFFERRYLSELPHTLRERCQRKLEAEKHPKPPPTAVQNDPPTPTPPHEHFDSVHPRLRSNPVSEPRVRALQRTTNDIYSRTQIENALRLAGGDLDQAAVHLLTGAVGDPANAPPPNESDASDSSSIPYSDDEAI